VQSKNNISKAKIIFVDFCIIMSSTAAAVVFSFAEIALPGFGQATTTTTTTTTTSPLLLLCCVIGQQTIHGTVFARSFSKGFSNRQLFVLTLVFDQNRVWKVFSTL